MKKLSLKSFVVLSWFLCVIYSLLIMGLSALGVSAVYTRRRSEVMSSCAYLLYEEQRAYKAKDEGFWKLYADIYSDAKALSAFRKYYSGSSDPSPYERTALVDMLRGLVTDDGDIQWIMLYRGENSYIFYSSSTILEKVAADFPYLDSVRNKRERMETYGYRGMPGIYAVAGGGIDSTEGAFVVGYRTAQFEKLHATSEMRGVANIQISIGDAEVPPPEVIYQSIGENVPPLMDGQFEKSSSAIIRASDGKSYDVQAIVHTGRGYQIALLVDHDSLTRMAGRDAPYIFGITLLLILVTIAMYAFLSRRVMHRVHALSASLERIGKNDFDAPVERYDPGDEFDQIAGAVERTRDQLKLSMRATMEAVAKREQAEMRALQARFNPHFLFNTIEVIRGRLQANGDDESAQMLGEMTRIFRSLLTVKDFGTVRDELSFCRSYIRLLKIRKKQDLSVIYDVDEAALECRIIRGLLQPLIENCVVHGFAHSEKNLITLKVKLENGFLLMTVTNDGEPITRAQLEIIRDRLASDDETGDTGNGLYGIARRIRVIYGETASLRIDSSAESDTCVTICVPCSVSESRRILDTQ